MTQSSRAEIRSPSLHRKWSTANFVDVAHRLLTLTLLAADDTMQQRSTDYDGDRSALSAYDPD